MSSASAESEREPAALSPGRVLVLFESSANGAAAIRQAAAAVGNGDGELVVVTLARQHPNDHCCGTSPQAINCALRAAADEELLEARTLVAALGAHASFRVLAGTPEPRLAAWVDDCGFDVVLVPRHRLVPRGHWAARRLRRSTAAEVRLVG